MAKPITLSHQVRPGGWESMISANGGLPAHRYTPQVTPRWSRGSEPASLDSVLHLIFPGDALGQVTVQTPENVARLSSGVSSPPPFYYQNPSLFACTLLMRHFVCMSYQFRILWSNLLWSSGIILRHLPLQHITMSNTLARASRPAVSCCCNSECVCVQGCVE